MATLTRVQLIARLVERYPLRAWGDGSVWVELLDAGLDDERVPVVFFVKFRAKGLVQEEVAAGEWILSAKGKRRLK